MSKKKQLRHFLSEDIKKSYTSRIYHYFLDLTVEQLRDELTKYPTTDGKIEYVRTSISSCRQINMLLGTLGAAALGILAAIMPKNGSWTFITFSSRRYGVVLSVCFVIFCYNFIQHVLLQHALEIINDEEIISQYKKTLEDKQKEIKDLLDELNLTKNDLDRNRTLVQIQRRVEVLRDQMHPHDIITDYLLHYLGEGEFSVALYLYDSRVYTVDSYQTSKSATYDPPSAFRTIIKFRNDPHRDYFVNKYLRERREGKECIYDKEKIQNTFQGFAKDINQYACCSLTQSGDNCFLLELIAYRETCFKQCTDQNSLEKYIDEVIKKYMPVINLFLDNKVLAVSRAR